MQKLESRGLLPQTNELDVESKINPYISRKIIAVICQELINQDNVEALNWLHEGGYTLHAKSLTSYTLTVSTSVQVKTWLQDNNLFTEYTKVWVEKS